MNVRLSKEQKIKILNADDLYRVMQQVLLRQNKIARHQEHFWVVGLNTQNEILFMELVALGAHNRVHAHPPDVFRMAIYKLAGKLILVHNHPTGVLQPSKADRDFTDRMLKVGQLIDVKVLDHLIISEESFASFDNLGIMEELRHSGLFEIVERQKDDIEAWKLKMEAERVEKEKALEIAKKMKEEGMDDEVILRITGLSMNTI